MYRVMLVDDEAGVRTSIKAKIDWEAAGFRIVEEASNGEEALSKMEEKGVPDLVISDIRMPQMDGLALIQACKERYPLLRTVILSGYSDFAYAKSAIQYGVKDYLLKPVVRSELTDTLARLATEIGEERRRKQEKQRKEKKSQEQLKSLQEQTLLQLVKSEWVGAAAVKERLQQLQLYRLTEDALPMQVVTAELRIPPGRFDEWNMRKDLLQVAFQMLGWEIAEKWPPIYPFRDVGQPALMHFLVVLDDPASRNGRADRLVRDLKHHVRKYLRCDSVIGVGEPIVGLSQLKNGYASSMLSWSQSTIQEDGVTANPRAMEFANAFGPETERKIIHAIETVDWEAFSGLVRALFPDDRDLPMFAVTFIVYRLILLLHAVARKFELGDSKLQQVLWNCQMNLGSGKSRDQVMEQLFELARMVMEEVRKTRFTSGQKIAEVIRAYVDENYSYDLTLASLADMFHMNENYLSGLFKQTAGATFSEYVTKLRLDKAAQLLKENELKLTDIATLVGYSTSSYFSTSFRKFYGMSPKEYRNRHSAGMPCDRV